MRKTLFGLALLTLALPPAALASVFDETEHISRTVKLDSGGTLRLRSFSGKVTITASDRPDVRIDAVRRATPEQLNRVTLDVHTVGSNVVVIDANHYDRSWLEFSRNNVVETDFDITVPRQTNLDLSVFSAPVTVIGVEGSHKAHGFSSRLQFEDVAGPVQARTFSGSVTIREKSWRPDQTIDVDTFSGNVELRVPEGARGAVSFSSFSGRLDSNVPLTLRNSSRRSLRAELGDGSGGSLRFKTFSGSVRIDR